MCPNALLAVLSNAAAGGIFFQELDALPLPSLAGIGAGFLVAVCGIGALSYSASPAAGPGKTPDLSDVEVAPATTPDTAVLLQDQAEEIRCLVHAQEED